MECGRGDGLGVGVYKVSDNLAMCHALRILVSGESSLLGGWEK